MAAKKPALPPADKVALYEKLVALFPDVERKGASLPYTSLNGNMFSFLNAEGAMGLRLPPTEREAFLKKHKTRLFEAHGTILNEYVTIPDALLRKTSELKKHFEESLVYARSLKAKPAKRAAKK
jgi:hypothetical protein